MRIWNRVNQTSLRRLAQREQAALKKATRRAHAIARARRVADFLLGRLD
jgi:hypothetical protein